MATPANAAEDRCNGSTPIKELPVELLDVQAVAALLGGCSSRHIFRLSDSGKMPRPVKLGTLVRWRRSDIAAWISAGCPSQQPTGRRS